MNLLEKVRHHGVLGSASRALQLLNQRIAFANYRFRHRHAPRYFNPGPTELDTIERDLINLGITVEDYSPSPKSFKAFKTEGWFTPDYHGGMNSGVWDEKLLEHWISSERLGLEHYDQKDTYVDIAAASSPWVQVLRERKRIDAYAIDLCEVGQAYVNLPYYRVENATKTAFDDASIRGATLHCAYEMFMGDDDTSLVHELARILQPGGKVIILPLYMHTHYCTYSTPECFGKGYSDSAAKEYIRLDCTGVPSSRKYDASMLKHRVLEPILALGLRYKLLAVRNKLELGKDIYCHFILEIER